jgi:hypothetical protein
VPYPLQWGAPTFDAGNAFAIMSAAFASLVEVSLLLVNFGYLYAPVKLHNKIVCFDVKPENVSDQHLSCVGVVTYPCSRVYYLLFSYSTCS